MRILNLTWTQHAHTTSGPRYVYQDEINSEPWNVLILMLGKTGRFILYETWKLWHNNVLVLFRYKRQYKFLQLKWASQKPKSISFDELLLDSFSGASRRTTREPRQFFILILYKKIKRNPFKNLYCRQTSFIIRANAIHHFSRNKLPKRCGDHIYDSFSNVFHFICTHLLFNNVSVTKNNKVGLNLEKVIV